MLILALTACNFRSLNEDFPFKVGDCLGLPDQNGLTNKYRSVWKVLEIGQIQFVLETQDKKPEPWSKNNSFMFTKISCK